MTEIPFQADADLRQAILTGAIRRQPNLDFRSANQAGLEGIKDPEDFGLFTELNFLCTSPLGIMQVE